MHNVLMVWKPSCRTLSNVRLRQVSIYILKFPTNICAFVPIQVRLSLFRQTANPSPLCSDHRDLRLEIIERAPPQSLVVGFLQLPKSF